MEKKKAYTPPKLKKWGKVKDLTKAGPGKAGDLTGTAGNPGWTGSVPPGL